MKKHKMEALHQMLKMSDLWFVIIGNETYTVAVVLRCSTKFRKIYRKTPCLKLLFINLLALRRATLLKRGFSTGVFL